MITRKIFELTEILDAELDTTVLLIVLLCFSLPDTADDLIRKRRQISTTSLAKLTGIPRETVRRKLSAIDKRGWICRDELGWRTTQTPNPASIQRFTQAVDGAALANLSVLDALHDLLSEMNALRLLAKHD